MKIFVTDTETTGLSPESNDLIEVAGCIYDTETKTILESYQSLLYGTENACESINHISPKALEKMPKSQDIIAKDTISGMIGECDVVIAHNAPFDKKFYEANGFEVNDKPWVCSRADIKYPGTHKSMRLGHLCYDFDVPVLKAHSALHDCYILIELLKNVPDLEEQLQTANEPKETYIAVVSFEDKDKAKEHGFSWDRSKKVWKKDLREEEVKKLEGVLTIKKWSE